MDSRQRMAALALSFPSLGDRASGPALGARPWDPATLERWANGPEPGRGALAAARFCLSVWDPHHGWACGPFTLADFATWDSAHRAAALAFLADPWWP